MGGFAQMQLHAVLAGILWRRRLVSHPTQSTEASELQSREDQAQAAKPKGSSATGPGHPSSRESDT